MDSERIGPTESRGSLPAIAILAGSGVSLASLLLAGLKGAPYLSLDSLNFWLVPFSIGFFVLLAAIPFAANARIVAGDPDRAEAWERAMLALGAVALPLALISGFIVWEGNFSTAQSLADAVALLVLIEAGIVVASLGAWLVSG